MKKKGFLVLEADKSNLNQFIFDLSWAHLDKVKGNEISRSEAIKRMNKAICKDLHYQCKVCPFTYDKEKREEFLNKDLRGVAEAALNALLEENTNEENL